MLGGEGMAAWRGRRAILEILDILAFLAFLDILEFLENLDILAFLEDLGILENLAFPEAPENPEAPSRQKVGAASARTQPLIFQ